MPGQSRLSIDHTGSYTVGMVAAAAIALYVGSLAPVLADDKFMSTPADMPRSGRNTVAGAKIGFPGPTYCRNLFW